MHREQPPTDAGERTLEPAHESAERLRLQRHAIGAALLFGAIALVGVYAAYGAVKDFAFARASGRWPTTEGVMLAPERGGEASVRYAYHYLGESYEGVRLSFRTRGYIGSPPPLAPGAIVPVYVRPDDAATAVLVPGGSGRRFAVWLAIAGAAVFVGVAGLTRAMMAFDFPEFAPRSRGDGGLAEDGSSDGG